LIATTPTTFLQSHKSLSHTQQPTVIWQWPLLPILSYQFYGSKIPGTQTFQLSRLGGGAYSTAVPVFLPFITKPVRTLPAHLGATSLYRLSWKASFCWLRHVLPWLLFLAAVNLADDFLSVASGVAGRCHLSDCLSSGLWRSSEPASDTRIGAKRKPSAITGSGPTQSPWRLSNV
jgi:hypothetical protein